MRLTTVGGVIGWPGPSGRTQETASVWPNPPGVSALRPASALPISAVGPSAARMPLGEP